MGIFFGRDDTLYATTWTLDAGLFTIDTNNGAASLVQRTGIHFAHGGDMLVPEPHGLALVCFGLLGLLVRQHS